MEKVEREVAKLDVFNIMGNQSGKVLSVAGDSMLRTHAQQKQCQCKRKPKDYALTCIKIENSKMFDYTKAELLLCFHQPLILR